MSKMLILIPPSEGKTPGGTHPPLAAPSSPVKTMIQQLQTYSGDLEKLLGVKGPALKKACQINTEILSNPTLPAIERYSGVVYKAIDYPSLDAKAKKFFNTHVRIISAIFGLVAPLDLIPDYKLKIDKLGAQAFWRDILTPQVKDVICFNLLPKAHQKAITLKHSWNIDFVITKNGKSTRSGHQGKYIKGRFVRWLCQNQITHPDDGEGFKEEGYHWTGTRFDLDIDC